MKHLLKRLAATSGERWRSMGAAFAKSFAAPPTSPPGTAAGAAAEANPLAAYFEHHHEGPGLWKWRHYFDAYHRHLAKFRGRAPVVAEVGIYSGGSLAMWREYFGPGVVIHGIDIEPSCRSYAANDVHVWIGDQGDAAFWAEFRRAVPALDILIDDGGHQPGQQRTTLEQTLGLLRPGGVYICEDVHGEDNEFAAYAGGLSGALYADRIAHGDDPERRLVSPATAFQSAVHSITHYPYLVVVERTDAPVGEFVAPKHGTKWEPFLK